MRLLGRTKFSNFEARPKTLFDRYFDFAKQKEVYNFQIPPIGRDIRVTNLKGEPICIGRRAVQRGRFRLIYKKISYAEQMEHAFDLIDTCFGLLEKVKIFSKKILSINYIS